MERRRRAARGWRADGGQSVVELALILPVLTLLVFGALEIGRVLNAWVIVTHASREGARVAAVRCSMDPACDTDVEARIDTSLTGLDPLQAVRTLSGGPYVTGDPVTVRIEYNLAFITPLIGALVPGGAVTVSGQTTMRLE